MFDKKQQIIELSKRIEAALHLIDRRVDSIELLLAEGRVKKGYWTIFEAERDVLHTIADALRYERSNPRPQTVTALGRTALVAATIAAGFVGGISEGALEELGSMATQKLVGAVEEMISGSDELGEPATAASVVSDEELDSAVEMLFGDYVPASRDDIPWDEETGEWVAPVVDLWDAIEASLATYFSEAAKDAVADYLLGRDGPDWIARSYLETMHE